MNRQVTNRHAIGARSAEDRRREGRRAAGSVGDGQGCAADREGDIGAGVVRVATNVGIDFGTIDAEIGGQINNSRTGGVVLQTSGETQVGEKCVGNGSDFFTNFENLAFGNSQGQLIASGIRRCQIR